MQQNNSDIRNLTKLFCRGNEFLANIFWHEFVSLTATLNYLIL